MEAILTWPLVTVILGTAAGHKLVGHNAARRLPPGASERGGQAVEAFIGWNSPRRAVYVPPPG